MHSKTRIALLGVALFAPLIGQAIAALFHNYGIGLVFRVFSHIGVPILAVMAVRAYPFSKAALLPIVSTKSHWPETRLLAFAGSLLAVVFIGGAYAFIGPSVDWGSVISSLSETYRVSSTTYPLIGLAIVLVNPFMEEYFWRGFIYRAFRDNTNSKRWKRVWLYATGIFFALHHVVIVSGWFVWWQWLLTVGFLALVGIVFNVLYERTDSIIASWVVHSVADAVIILIGAHLFGFV